jgi:ABC-type dipeptide/oligopeptide/nickel transport system permease component
MGMSFSRIIGGSVLIETVFSIPGVGRLSVGALFNQDYSIIQAVTLVLSATVVIINFLVDIAYGWIDPRIRYG